MAWTAYLTAVAAGLSLVLLLPRGRQSVPFAFLLPPIGLAALAAIWEASVPRSANIRVDLLLLVPLLASVEGICGLGLAIDSINRQRTRRPAATSGLAAAICLAASGFVVVATI